MKRSILKYGLISGLIVSVFMAISMAVVGCSSGESGMGAWSMVIGFTSMALAFSFIFVGIKDYRDKQNAGTITFGKAFLIGFMISLIASTLYVMTWAIEYHFFLPDFMDKYSAMQIKQLQQSGLSGAKLEEGIKSIETASYNYKHSPFYFAIYTYMEILPVGIIITLISSLILKRKEPVKSIA